MGFFDNAKHFFDRKREEKSEAKKVVKSKQKAKINRKDEMSSVLDETEVQSALSSMSKEPKLRAHDQEDETKPMYITMLLKAEDIGGISIRRRKDKTIGQLVEAIKSNRIMAYIPAELMAKNELLIIPTPTTLDAMSDFTVLTSDKLKYELAVVIPDGRGKATIGFADKPALITYNTMREYVTDDDTNTPNQFLDQFKFFDDVPAADNTAKVGKSAKLDDIPDDTKSDNGNQSTSTADVLKQNVGLNNGGLSEGDNASTVSDGTMDDTSTPFSMGMNGGEPNFGNTNPTEKDNSGDIEVPSSQLDRNNSAENANNTQDSAANAVEQNNNVDDSASDPVTAGLADNNQVSSAAQPQAAQPSQNNEQANSGVQNTEQDDFANESNDMAESQPDNNQDVNEQTQDDFGGIDQVDNNNEVISNSGANNLAVAQNQTNNQAVQSEQDDVQVPESEEQLDDAIKRVFYGNNLNLKVTTEPIDLLLMHNNDIVPFDTNRGDGFLNQYLNQMSREANQALLRKHNDNIAATRSFWYNAVVKGVEKIVSEVDDTNKNTDYGKQKLEIDNNKNMQIAQKKSDLKPKFKQMDDNLEKAANADAQRAYDQAKQDYLDRFRSKTNAAKDQLLDRELQSITEDANVKLKNLQDRESAYASQMYDQLVSDSTTSAMNYYKKLRNGERKNEQEWRRKLRTYTDHHRKEQVAHDKALQAEIDQERESREQQKQFDAQVKALNTKLADQKKSADDRIKALEAQNAQDLDALRSENKNLKSSYEQKLVDKDIKHSREMADMKREYETKLNSLREEKQEKVTELNSDHAAQLTKMRDDNAAEIEQLKHANAAKMRSVQQLNQDKIDQLTEQIHDLTKTIQNGQDEREKLEKEHQRQMDRKDDLVKSLRDENNSLNDDLNNVQSRAEDNLRNQMEAKYTGQLEMLKESNNNLKNALDRQKDENKNQESTSKSTARSFAAVAAIVGALIGIGGSMLFNQNHEQSLQANQQEQIKQAVDSQKSEDDAKLDDAIDRAIAKAQSSQSNNSNSSNNSSNSGKSKKSLNSSSNDSRN